MDNFGAEAHFDEEDESWGVWRSSMEFSAIIAESSVRAGIVVGYAIGYTTLGVYCVGFLNKYSFPCRVRKGTRRKHEYSVESQLEALSDALNHYCRRRSAEEREIWWAFAKEMIEA